MANIAADLSGGSQLPGVRPSTLPPVTPGTGNQTANKSPDSGGVKGVVPIGGVPDTPYVRKDTGTGKSSTSSDSGAVAGSKNLNSQATDQINALMYGQSGNPNLVIPKDGSVTVDTTKLAPATIQQFKQPVSPEAQKAQHARAIDTIAAGRGINLHTGDVNIDQNASILNDKITKFNAQKDTFKVQSAAFDTKWSPYIKNGVFTGTDADYLKYQSDLKELNGKANDLTLASIDINAWSANVSKAQSKKAEADLAQFNKNNVKLGDGTYISKDSYDEIVKADKAAADTGIALGYDAMLFRLKDDAGVVDPPTAQDIKNAQAQYFQQHGWDISDKSNPEYTKRLLEATRNFSDANGITTPKILIDDETRADRIATVKESVVQLLPFSSLWDKNQAGTATWQKVAFTTLDVVTLIPVLGLAAKGAGALIKSASLDAKVASMGGKEAIDLALKNATEGLDKATVELTAKRALLEGAQDAVGKADSAALKKALSTAVKYGQRDVELADKELTQLTRNVEDLQKLSDAAKDMKAYGAGGVVTPADLSKGAKTYNAISKMADFGGTKAGKAIDAVGGLVGAGVIGSVTVANWQELSPAQRVLGLVMAGLSAGLAAPAIKSVRSVAEDVANPYKIPTKAIQARPTGSGSKAIPGTIWAEEGGAAGGTTRLVIDKSIPMEDARRAMADLQRQLHETGGTARVTYGDHEIEIKGTGFQDVVGGNVSFSATPFGEVYQQGTGAFKNKAGLPEIKTKMEAYLTKLNEKLPEGEKIEIKSRPYTVKNLETGKLETKTIKTNVEPGTTLVGREGGQYVGQTLYTKFSHQAANSGVGKGNIEAGLIIHDAGIDKLPEWLAREKIDKMRLDGYKYFNANKDPGKIVEGFKRYRIFQEAENVITGGTQELRVQNLRSKLADILHQGKGEYFTRDSQGKIELFQMYIEGGRTTPYTLKELYKLKANGLKNALEDLGYGLDQKLKALAGSEKSPVEKDLVTKEEQMADDFKKLDNAQTEGRLTSAEVDEAKRAIRDEYRVISTPAYFEQSLEKVAARTGELARTPNLNTRAVVSKTGLRQTDINRTQAQTSNTGRVTKVQPGTDRIEAVRTEGGRKQPARTTINRVETVRNEPVRTPETDRIERAPTDINRTPVDINRTIPPIGRTNPPIERTEPPRETVENPRVEPPRVEPPKPPTGKPPYKGKLPETPNDNINRPWTDEEIKHASAIKAGFGYWLKREDGRVKFFRKLPPGVKASGTGPGSGYRSAQTVVGTPSNDVIKIGFLDANLNKPPHIPGSANHVKYVHNQNPRQGTHRPSLNATREGQILNIKGVGLKRGRPPKGRILN
jgi:hypothetical protein